MRIVRYADPDSGRAVVGYLDGDHVVPVTGGDGAEGLAAVLELAAAANDDDSWLPAGSGPPRPVAEVALLSPVRPTSVRDFYAFEQHVATARRARGLDVDPDWYGLPVFYFSNPASVVGHRASVAAPPRSHELDYELEVAVVIGRDSRDVPVESASDVVAGFCVMNDWSARDLQRREMRQQLGPVKGKDFATSLGPALVTRREFAPDGLRDVPSALMTAHVNGAEWSRADLSTLWWSFAEMVAYASEAAPLRAGDVLGSGTCGTGCILELAATHGSERYPWLQPGDEVSLTVEGLGTLSNTVVPARGPAWSPDPDRTRPRLSAPPVAGAQGSP